MRDFTREHRTTRVRFGGGASQLAPAQCLRELGAARVLIVCSPGRADAVSTVELGELGAGVHAGAVPHVPVHAVTAAVAAVDAARADWVLAYGGGAAVGLAKGVALQRDVKLAAIPTTYAGSEMTPVFGLSDGGQKRTGRDERVRPRLVIYDPALTNALPVELTVTSLFNAMAHAIEATYAEGVESKVVQRALESIQTIAAALPALYAQPDDPVARADALYGAHLAACCLADAGMGLHHKLCHVLGGAFLLPHAKTHTVVLPHAVHYNQSGAPNAVAAVGEALGSTNAAAAIFDLMSRVGAPTSLRAIGMNGEDLERAADLAVAKQYPNPREVTRSGLARLIQSAYLGRRPSRGTTLRPLGGVDGPHKEIPLAIRGVAVESANAAVLCVHGRGATSDRLLRQVEAIIGPRTGWTLVGVQAYDNSWYPGGFRKPQNENQPHLDSALSVLTQAFELVSTHVPPQRVIVLGFSQGACLAVEWVTRRGGPLGGLAVLSGGLIGPEAVSRGGDLSGVPVFAGVSREDEWVPLAAFEETVTALRSQGARVDDHTYEGAAHAINSHEKEKVRAMVDTLDSELSYLSGFGSVLQSEALPGALPARQNSPRRPPYGLYAEQINGTPFTQRRHESRRVWLYRIRPSIGHSELSPVPDSLFCGTFDGAHVAPNLRRWKPLTIPSGPAVDFIDGLRTLGGTGSPDDRGGFAVHLYAANASMEDRTFYNADGDLLIVPERGVHDVMTEMGRLRVAPGEVLIVPRGVKFSVRLPQSEGRGYVLEVYGSFRLPERGPIGANGLADERHFLAPTAAYEDRDAPHELLVKFGGRLFTGTMAHSPYDVVAWHGNHVPFKYDLSNFNAFGSVTWDHPDPSVLTVLTCPLDDHGQATADFVCFGPRWEVSEQTLRPPYYHRNAATEFNGIVSVDAVVAGYEPGSCWLTPPLTAHGIATRSFENHYGMPEERAEKPKRLSDKSVWIMFESALGMRLTDWALNDAPADGDFRALFGDIVKHFDPSKP